MSEGHILSAKFLDQEIQHANFNNFVIQRSVCKHVKTVRQLQKTTTGTRIQEHKNTRQSEMNSFCQQCYKQIIFSSTMTVRPLKLVVVIVYKYCICYIIITLHTLHWARNKNYKKNRYTD